MSNISVQGRATQGVKLINLREGDQVSAIEVIHPEEEGGEPLFEGDDSGDTPTDAESEE